MWPSPASPKGTCGDHLCSENNETKCVRKKSASVILVWGRTLQSAPQKETLKEQMDRQDDRDARLLFLNRYCWGLYARCCPRSKTNSVCPVEFQFYKRKPNCRKNKRELQIGGRIWDS